MHALIPRKPGPPTIEGDFIRLDEAPPMLHFTDDEMRGLRDFRKDPVPAYLQLGAAFVFWVLPLLLIGLGPLIVAVSKSLNR